jgi:two-component system, NarL family, nitrate/nitrite response regulator NarL
VANILIFSSNAQLMAEWSHALISDHSVGRLLNIGHECSADAVIFDAKKLDEDIGLISIFGGKNTRYLVIGEDWPEQRQIDVLAHGAAGYCDASEAPKLLSRAIESVLKGDIWMRRSLVPKVIGVLIDRHRFQATTQTVLDNVDDLIKMVDSLSSREVEVADMIRQGENNKRIALTLNISERTVKAHLSSIFRKFNVDDRLRLAIRLKEIEQYRKMNA